MSGHAPPMRLARSGRDLARLVKSYERVPGPYRKYPSSDTRFRVAGVDVAEGAIAFNRRMPGRGRGKRGGEVLTAAMLDRLADALVAGVPVKMDALFNGSHNSRSALEAMVALLIPECHLVYLPGNGPRPIKHLVYLPGMRHPVGTPSVVPVGEIDPVHRISLLDREASLPKPPRAKTEHLAVQAMLIEIGRKLGHEVCVARNDVSSVVAGKPLGRHKGVKEHRAVKPFSNAIPEDADLIDVIWIRKGKAAVAAMFEVEATTGITSGLTRMRLSIETLGRAKVKHSVAVVPGKDAARALRKAMRVDFARFGIRVMTFDSVRALYAFCLLSEKPVGITPRFLENYFEPRDRV